MIHFIWLGSPVSDEDTLRMEAYGEYNLITEIPPHLKELCDYAQTWHAKSDLIRYWLMYEYGGVYLDTDCVKGNLPLPTHTCVGGCTKVGGEKCWSNFLCSAAAPHDDFWKETLERCKRQDYVEPREPMSLFFYNIECIWGITPIIPTVECWQNDSWFAKPDEYVVHHLARTNPNDYITYSRNGVVRKRRNRAIVDEKRCDPCEHFNKSNELCRKHGCVGRARIPNADVRCPSGRW